jgi:hypothetical protein
MPSAESALKIAKALKVSVEYLMTGQEDPKVAANASLPADIHETVHLLKKMTSQQRQLVHAIIVAVKENC